MQSVEYKEVGGTYGYQSLWTRSRGSSVGIAMGYGLDDRDSIPGRGKKLFSTPQRLDQLWCPRSLISSGYKGLKWPGPEADHSPPCSAEVKNGGVIPPFPNKSSCRGA
jgi:hypothetical protein